MNKQTVDILYHKLTSKNLYSNYTFENMSTIESVIAV